MAPAEYDYLELIAQKYPKGDVIIGGTALGDDVRTIQRVDGKRNIIVIDSFLGLADPTEEDMGECSDFIKKGEFSVGGLDAYLQGFTQRGLEAPKEIYEMWIDPKALRIIPKRPVGIIFLDLDHYAPTKACLEYFSSWLINPSIIIVHDYEFERCPGIKKCCDEFIQPWTKPDKTGFGVHFIGEEQ